MSSEKTKKECGICVYKYSCGYSSLLSGRATGECVEPHLFMKTRKRFWSLQNQQLETEEEILKEERRAGILLERLK